jgi:hypothetical protein
MSKNDGTDVERVFISRTLTSQNAWESIVDILHKHDLALFQCDENRYFGLAIKEIRYVTILIWGQNNFIPLLEGTKGLVAKAYLIQKQCQRNLKGWNVPRKTLISPPVPSEEAKFTAKTSGFVRKVLKLISKLPFLKMYFKDILLAFKDAEKISKWSQIPPSNSKLVDQHTRFEWALERLKLSTNRTRTHLEKIKLPLSSSTLKSFLKFTTANNIEMEGKKLFKATPQLHDNDKDKNCAIDYALVFTNIINTFETYSTYLSNSAESWQDLINSVMNSKDNMEKNSNDTKSKNENKNDSSSSYTNTSSGSDTDDDDAVSDEEMTLKTIDCISGIPWNAVCRRTMAVFVKYLTANYKDQLINEQGFDNEILMNVVKIPNECLPPVMVNESKHRFRTILTDRCKWKCDTFMENARKICAKNVKYLLDEDSRGDGKILQPDGENKTSNQAEKAKCGMFPFSYIVSILWHAYRQYHYY